MHLEQASGIRHQEQSHFQTENHFFFLFIQNQLETDEYVYLNALASYCFIS